MSSVITATLRPPTWLRPVRILGLLIVTGVLVRLALALVHPLTFPDSLDYLHLASRIENGQSYRVTGMYAKRLPGYPVFMACVLITDGGHKLGILVWQAIISGWMIYLAWRLGSLVDSIVGLLSAALTALDPLLIGFAASYLTETLFTALFLCTLLIFARWCQQPQNKLLPVLLAALFTIDVYVRAEIALCIFPLLAWYVLALEGKGRARRVLVSCFVLLMILAGMMPWWVRNWEIFHSNFFRFSTLEGISLYESVYHGATGGPRQSDIKWPAYMKKLNESQRDNRWTAMSFAIIRHHPWRILRLAFVKICRTWSPWLHAKGYRSMWVNIVLSLWYVAEYVLAFLGLLHLRRRGPWLLFGITVIPILYLTAMHALFLGSVRYRVPLIPLVGILAAVGLRNVLGAWIQSNHPAASTGGSSAVVE